MQTQRNTKFTRAFSPSSPPFPFPSHTYLEHLILKHGLLVHCSLSVHLIRRDMQKSLD